MHQSGKNWQKNTSQVQEDVNIDYVLLPYLIEKEVLEQDCKRQYKGLSNAQQTDLLLSTLKGLPEEKEAYKHLIEGLRTSDFEEYSELADKIDATVTHSDSSVYAKVNPKHHSKKVRGVLNANFATKDGQKTSLTLIKAVLKDNNVFGRTPWSDEELTEFVCQLFAGIEVLEKQDFLKTHTDILFKHLVKLDKDGLEEDRDVNISSLSASQVRSFLSRALEKEHMSSDSLLEMEKQDVTGGILLDMNEKDLLEVMPSSTFGQRRKIKKIIDNNKVETGNGKKVERPRPFDSEVTPNTCYILGNVVDTKTRTRGTKLSPVRNFHLPEPLSDIELKQYIVIQCAIFAAACINERQNGTVYFGISPDETGGREKGEIEGIRLSLGDLDDRLMTLFFPSQEHLVKNALRNARYVPVVKDGKCSALSNPRHVIEFDVVPSSSLKEKEYIRINAKDLPNPIENYQSIDPVFKLSEYGEPKSVSPSDICSNTKVPSSTINQRGKDEFEKFHKKKGPDCLTRLRNHLTGGSYKMEDDIYKVLLLSSIGDSSIDANNLDFIQNLKPEVVFDFDPRVDEGVFNALEERGEVLKLVTVDDFDEKKRGKKDIKSLKTELAESNYLHWVFCNGFHDAEQMNEIHWNKKRRPAFRKAFDYYLKSCHKDRLLIIICLFSHNNILIEACDEILVDLSDQWILLSENMSDARMWQETFKSRNRVDRNDLKHRCIIGLPWEQVNNGISSWCGKDKSQSTCQIPHSSGTTVTVEKKMINEWNDIEILSTLDPVFEDDKASKEKQLEVEKGFYCGGQVQWLNFFFKQVCQRIVHGELYKLVCSALEGRSIEDDNKVLPVYMFHQPGAGGSTSAREILWSLRGSYRCCVMKRFTNQTVNQLIEIFSFKEKSRSKPLLVLIDNEDEANIRLSLEEKLRGSDVVCSTFCVLLICYRTVFVPIDKRNLSMVTLKQYLHRDELFWFEMRYKDLTSRYENPKSLISFNILKTNFDKSYIQKTVREYVTDIDDEIDKVILKFVSLINTFDLDFKPIPVSCFDVLLKSMGSEPKSALGTSIGWVRNTRWEANVSQSFKVLLNLNDQNEHTRKTIRVFNKLIAEHILKAFTAKTGESESELIHCLLTDDIFDENDEKEMITFQEIIANMIKKRAIHDDSVKRDKFSPLILSVRKKENPDKAVEIMERLFQLNDDPYTAQQIARFYIDCKKFEEAAFYAETAVSIMPSNSSLIDTHAQVFKSQMLEEIQTKSVSEDKQFTESEIKDLIALCMKCSTLFKKEQALDDVGSFNSSDLGYFGELESVELILKAFQKCKCFKSKSKATDIMHKYLVNDAYTHERLGFLSLEESNFLRSLWSNSKEAISKLDDMYLQMKQEIPINPLIAMNESKKKLSAYKAKLNEFFGERHDDVPSQFNEKEACEYRSRLVFSKKASSLSQALDLKHDQKDNELSQCYGFLFENIQSEHATVDDFKSMLDITTVLLLDGPIPKNLRFEDIIGWTEQFYQNSWRETGRPHLEAFMYFLLYNFPTEERQSCPTLASAPNLLPVLESWKETFQKSKRWPHNITHRATTLFFLGKGQPLHDIVSQKRLSMFVVEKEGWFTWDSRSICDILRVMEGILMQGGDFIKFTDKRGSTGHEIQIKTSLKIDKNVMWRNKVYFYLGFSFSGLRAYGTTKNNPLK